MTTNSDGFKMDFMKFSKNILPHKRFVKGKAKAVRVLN
jgi:hypothetical protein